MHEGFWSSLQDPEDNLTTIKSFVFQAETWCRHQDFLRNRTFVVSCVGPECDKRIAAVLKRLKEASPVPAAPLPAARHKGRSSNPLTFDVREALYAVLGIDLTQIHGLGPYLALKLVGECGTDLSAWPSAKHFTSWLGLAPHNKISGGKVLSSR